MDESNGRMPLSETSVPPAEQARVDRPHAPSLNAPVCPYCGVRTEPGAERCGACKGLQDPLSRQATQNAMGPWAVRDDAANCTPGFSYETLRSMVMRGRIRRDTIVRGPTTRQFWMFAANTPGVAVLLGECGLSLATDRDALSDRRGVLTPVAAMGDVLLTRLPAAGVSLETTALS